MATTRLIAMHVNEGSTAGQCFQARIRYVINPAKTEQGALVTSYLCDVQTAAMEFDYMRRNYLTLTGRRRADEVIAYQLRQSFKPGEVTAEEANKLGCELARRFLKGNHAYIVATHVDKVHIHNHIVFCATTQDCLHKFRNFLGSGKALGRLSDQICMEHKLSVITSPKPRDCCYDKWLGNDLKLTGRDRLRTLIDELLQKKPDGFAALMKLLEEAGCQIKYGKQISLCLPDGKRFMRMDTLGDEYSEQALRDVLAGKRPHLSQPTRRMKKLNKVSLLIDIQAKLEAGKGAGYEKWAKRFNLKQLSGSFVYLTEHGIDTYEELTARVNAAVKRNDELLEKTKATESRMTEIAAMKKTIHDYLKTKDVYASWKASGWSRDFYAAHEQELCIHKAAKKAFDEIGGKIPTIKELSAEYASLLEQKQKSYAEYRTAREQMRELLTAKANIDTVTQSKEDSSNQHQNHTR